jgi:hypothetical protein
VGDGGSGVYGRELEDCVVVCDGERCVRSGWGMWVDLPTDFSCSASAFVIAVFQRGAEAAI